MLNIQKIPSPKRRSKKLKYKNNVSEFKFKTIIILTIAIIFVLIYSLRINETIATNKPDGSTIQNNGTSSKPGSWTGSKPNKAPSKNEPIPVPKGTDIIKGKNVTYDGEKHSMPAKDVQNILTGKFQGDKKHIFLTFDDGPSPKTELILDILKEKDVKATFFVLGNRLETNNAKEILKRTISDGHAIANHSYTHDFKKLYPNNSIDVPTIMNEIDATNNKIKEVLGEDFDSGVVRIPGGYNSREYYNDPSLPDFDAELEKNNIVSIDWNALNGDAESKEVSTDEMLSYAIETSQNRDQIILLMHDSSNKQKTVEMLPSLIDYYKEKGYEFNTISN